MLSCLCRVCGRELDLEASIAAATCSACRAKGLGPAPPSVEHLAEAARLLEQPSVRIAERLQERDNSINAYKNTVHLLAQARDTLQSKCDTHEEKISSLEEVIRSQSSGAVKSGND